MDGSNQLIRAFFRYAASRNDPPAYPVTHPLRALLSAFLALALLLPPVLDAQTQAAEYRIKAAFLFHFAQLVDWPAGGLGPDSQPVNFCVLGDELTPGTLASTVEGKLIGAHKILVRNIHESDSLRGCQLVFFVTTNRKWIASSLTSLQSLPVLTIGDTEDFVRTGGMIGFCIRDQKVRFDINLHAAQRANLKVSSRLLLLANSVVGESGAG